MFKYLLSISVYSMYAAWLSFYAKIYTLPFQFVSPVCVL